MIRTIRHGFYKLIATKHHVKVLYLDNNTFGWPELTKYSEMLVVSHRKHRADALLSMGYYNLYEVADEPSITDNFHLELEVGQGAWQGYLLLTGLPDNHKTRGRIIPTKETITGNPRYKHRNILHDNLAKNLNTAAEN